jgi:hypothetical protein
MLTPSELLRAVALLQQLAEQARQSRSAVPADLKATWHDLERRLLLGLRAEERAVAAAGADPLRVLKTIGANEAIRNLVWEVSVALELQSFRAGALLKLAELLQARAQVQPQQPRLHPAA